MSWFTKKSTTHKETNDHHPVQEKNSSQPPPVQAYQEPKIPTFGDICKIVNYGVLGSAMSPQDRFGPLIQVGETPTCNHVIVDPAGVHIITNGFPSDAGGASGSIYRLCGLYDEFPHSVTQGIRNAGDVVFCRYGRDDTAKNVVHAAGFDLRRVLPTIPESYITEILSNIYVKIFRATLSSALPFQLLTLRLLPISGGIFAGDFKPYMVRITLTAITSAFKNLSQSEQADFITSIPSVELCLFEASEFKEYKHGWETLFASGSGSVFEPTHIQTHPQIHSQTHAQQSQTHTQTHSQTHPQTDTNPHPHPQTETHAKPQPQTHTQAHIQPHTQTHTQSRTQVPTQPYTQTHAHTQPHTQTYTQPHTQTHTQTRTQTYTQPHTQTHAHTQPHTQPQAHTQRHTQPRTQTYTQPHTQTHAQTHTQAHTQPHTQPHTQDMRATTQPRSTTSEQSRSTPKPHEQSGSTPYAQSRSGLRDNVKFEDDWC